MSKRHQQIVPFSCWVNNQSKWETEGSDDQADEARAEDKSGTCVAARLAKITNIGVPIRVESRVHDSEVANEGSSE